MPTALRMPDAKTRKPVPSGRYSRMSARRSSRDIPLSASFECEPTETNIFFPSLRERDVARPVPAAAQQAAGRDVRHDHLRFGSRVQVSVLVREPHDAARLADVDEARIRAGRIEGDAERPVEARREDLVDLRLARAVFRAQHAHAAGPALGDEEIAVRRGADQPRIVEAGLELLDAEAGGRLRPGVRGPRDDSRAVVDGLRRVGRRQVRRADPPADSGRIRRPVAERALSAPDLGGGRGRPAPGPAGPPPRPAPSAPASPPGDFPFSSSPPPSGGFY